MGVWQSYASRLSLASYKCWIDGKAASAHGVRLSHMESEGQQEKPLNGAAKGLLMLSAGATIFCFYLFLLLAVLLLVVILAVELILAVILLRFGLVGLVAREMEKQVQLLGLVGRSFLLSQGAEYRIVLQPEDAPGLFASLKQLCARLGVNVPEEVSLEMNAGAWVRLKGVRRNAGTTILGVGYDLLAGLTTTEVEAVLAHEMVHARLVQRGLKRWLSGGLGRAAKLSGSLAGYINAYERAHVSDGFAGPMYAVADWHTKLAARLIAAYARQDEFEADRGAAELCGASPIRSSLIKLGSLQEKLARLPWHERVARFQLGEGFSRWLVQELSVANITALAELPEDVRNKYATHPVLHDRLAALPADSRPVPEGQAPGLSMLADPDAVAEKLIAEIQRVWSLEEERDSQELRRWAKKVRKSNASRPLQLTAWIIGLVGSVFSLFLWANNGMSLGLGAFVVFILAGSIWLHRFGRYRDRVALPVPDYAVIMAAAQSAPAEEERQAQQKLVDAELAGLVAGEKKPRDRAALLLKECYGALEACNYLRAYVAARKCRDEDPDSIEGDLGILVAAAGLALPDPYHLAFQRLQRCPGFPTASTVWAAAWALVLCHEWARAEAFLHVAIKDRPDESTLHLLLAVCQSRRGKLQGAILSARRACTPAPRNKEHAKLFLSLLLDGGFLREVREHFVPFEEAARSDAELAFCKVRLSLLHRQQALAAEWTAVVKQAASNARLLIRLAAAYETAREDGTAATLYQEALALGFYPEACLGLAHLANSRKDRPAARQHLLDALDVVRPLGPEAIGPLPLFQRTLELLLALEEPILDCQAHVAKFGAHIVPQALKNLEFLVFARSPADAEEYVNVIRRAMHPGCPPPLPLAILWRVASKQQQPDGPVRPGVQGVLD